MILAILLLIASPILLFLLFSRDRALYFYPFIFAPAVIAASCCVYVYFNGAIVSELPLLGFNNIGASVGFVLDPLSALISTVVLTIGAVVSRYTVRYLEDEPRQRVFLLNLAKTISFVLLMVLAKNLILFFLAWVGTSYSLHHLLIHYKERAGATSAAEQKFWISRLGDIFLLSGIVLVYLAVGSFDFSTIFKAVESNVFVTDNGALLTCASILFVFGACVKSAQFPFHYWLPNTMETPTPVSALMHAGIINAGGYLVIRMSPLIANFPIAMQLLVLIGAFSACYASLVSLTQPDVKRQLAYSTIAQMGFMIVQCGLGAFVVATLHLVGHAFYKAYAFCSAGTVTEYGLLYGLQKADRESSVDRLWPQFFSLIISVSLLIIFAQLLYPELVRKNGAYLLLTILSLAMAQSFVLATTLLQGAVVGGALCFLYILFASVLGGYLGDSLGATQIAYEPLVIVIHIFVAVMFFGLYLIQNNLVLFSESPLGRALYAFLRNDSYFNVKAKRWELV